MPSLCKHHVDTADAKRPKHRAQTPKTSKILETPSGHELKTAQAKKRFHVTFGIHIKQSLEPQSTCPAYANTI